MEKSQKTKAELIEELAKLRRRIDELSSGDVQRRECVDVHRNPILDEIDDGYYEIDLNGNYTYVNRALCTYQGRTAEELIGRDSRESISSRFLPKAHDFFVQVLKTGRPGRLVDYEFVHKSGEVRFIDLSVSLIRNAEGQPVGFRGIVRDRTEGRLRELDLERYRVFVESIEDGCFEVDLEGKFTFLNSAMCRIHGYPYEELLGISYRNFASPEDTKAIFKVFNSIYRTGFPARIFDYSVIRKDGEIRNLEVSASLMRDPDDQPCGFRGILRDRTERKAKEKALERYQAFVEGVGDGCFEANLRGDITFCNDAACRMFGYPADQFLGMNNRSYTSSETAKRVYRIFNKIYRTGRPGEVRDYEIHRGDGTKSYLHATVALVKDGAGNPVGFRGICRDISEQKKAETENERLISLVNQAQRLEAIATLAAGVAHNFNNLLMSIQGFVSLMFLDIDGEHPHFSRLKTIEDLIKRGSDLTTQLLGYARHGRFAVKPVDVHITVKSAFNVLKTDRPEIAVALNLPDKLWAVAADHDQIDGVFKHLFANAAEAMPGGGTIQVRAENILLKEHFVAAHGLNPGPYVKMAVTDTGVGMDHATRERIFEPFFSTKEASRGAGLGLASVYGTIQSHNGIILVESEKDRGSTFTIFLPAITKEAKEDTSLERPVNGLSPTILMVDDERVICEVTSDIISKMGYQTIITCDGAEALEIFQARQDEIDLVIVDMVMPGLSGEQVVEAMRKIVPDIKAILISGFPDAKEVQEAMRDTRQAFLQKPLQSKSLSATIRQLLEV